MRKACLTGAVSSLLGIGLVALSAHGQAPTIESVDKDVKALKTQVDGLKEALKRIEAAVVKQPAKVKTAAKDREPFDKLVKSLERPAKSAAGEYQAGRYAESANRLQGALQIALPVLKELAANEKRVKEKEVYQKLSDRVTIDYAAAAAVRTDWYRAIKMRTIINDIWNLPSRGNPKTLEERLGGAETLKAVMQEAVAAQRSSGTTVAVADDPLVSMFALGSRRVNVTDAQFTYVSRHLWQALRIRCVPDEDIRAYFKVLKERFPNHTFDDADILDD